MAPTHSSAALQLLRWSITPSCTTQHPLLVRTTTTHSAWRAQTASTPAFPPATTLPARRITCPGQKKKKRFHTPLTEMSASYIPPLRLVSGAQLPGISWLSVCFLQIKMNQTVCRLLQGLTLDMCVAFYCSQKAGINPNIWLLSCFAIMSVLKNVFRKQNPNCQQWPKLKRHSRIKFGTICRFLYTCIV